MKPRPLLDVNHPENTENSKNFLKFAQEELTRLETLTKPTNKEEEKNLVWKWAVNVYEKGTGKNLDDKAYKVVPDGILYKLSQRTIRGDDVAELNSIYYRKAPFDYHFLHLLLMAAVSPYLDGRPDLSDLKKFLAKGVQDDDLVREYIVPVTDRGRAENTKQHNSLREKQEQERKKQEHEREEQSRRELNPFNFNELQNQVGSLQSNSEDRYAKFEERFAKLEQRLTSLENENRELKQENQTLKEKLKAPDQLTPSSYINRFFGRGGTGGS